MSRESRLWRMLGLTQPLMRVWTPDDTNLNLNDHNVKSINISRGGADGGPGPQDHTLEVATVLPLGVRTGMRLYCDLSSYGTARLAALIGSTPDRIRRRFFGRIGRQTIDDNGGSDGSKWYATLYAASWQAQLKNVDKTIPEVAWTQLRVLIQNLSRPTGVGLPFIPPTEAPASGAEYGNITANGEPVSFQNGANRWITEPGIYVQNHRDGHDRFLPMKYRWDQAVAKMDTTMPLTRSQAISPATWDQPAENMPRSHSVTWSDRTSTRTFTRGDDETNPYLPVVEYDLTHVRWDDNLNQPMLIAESNFYRERNSGYKLPSITIDMLRLITSPVPYHRVQARQLLELEMGDPVYLSNDWNVYLRGIQFASGIEESITPDGWEIKLSLTTSQETVGQQTPEVPAQIWESMVKPWQETSGQWQTY